MRGLLALAATAMLLGSCNLVPQRTLTACADPNNLPFSNEAGEGFENKLAQMIASDLHAKLNYVWWAQRRGYVRNTLNERKCNFWPGIGSNVEMVATTRPYYRSTYMFVTRRAANLGGLTLDDPRLKKLKIGVHLLGDDYTNPPPVHELSKRGVVDNVVGFNTFYSETNPPGAIIDAVAAGRVDLAIVWGPLAGYYAKRQRTAMEIVPIPSGPGDLPFTFDISMGVKKGNDALYAQVEHVLEKRQSEITKILMDYDVPLLATR